jgi:thiol-disulfide isomerase/thioredoxin
MTTPPTTPRKGLVKALLPVIVIVLVVVGALYVIKAQMPQKAASTGASGLGQEAGAPQSGAQVGATLPDFELNGIAGTKSAKLSEFHGGVTLVNFWATWCEACMEEMPSIVQLRDAYKDKGFEVVGVNLDENGEAVVPKAIKQLKIQFPVFQDHENKIAEYFDVHAIPLSVVLNKDRKILYIENGERNWNDQESRNQLEKWLAGS